MATRRVVIHYPRHLIDSPLISKMVREFDLDFNILRANITPQSEGVMVLALEGTVSVIDRALHWVRGQGVGIQSLDRDVCRDEDRCTQCGACATICPTGALRKQLDTQEVTFSPDECIACELCVPACPPRAMTVAL
jgi:NAD-dependent dihydropyrimidine dehydrogenase PreA subunit